MSVLKKLIVEDILNKNKVIDEVITFWENKYQSFYEDVLKKFHNAQDNDEICNKNEMIKKIIECKSLVEVEYDLIKEIRSELEDCQIISELTETIREAEKLHEQSENEIKRLREKIIHLSQEKKMVENKLNEQMGCSTIFSSLTLQTDNSQKSSMISLKENIKSICSNNSSVSASRLNKISDYCHIAAPMYSSDGDVSEEDSLEKDKNKDQVSRIQNGNGIDSPYVFHNGISTAHKSTPIKTLNNANEDNLENQNNLTQDLKDINEILEEENHQLLVNNSAICDWEMTQPSVQVSGNKLDIFTEIKDSNNSVPDFTEKEFENSYKKLIDQIFTLHSRLYIDENNGKSIPSCSGDQPTEQNPIRQLENIIRCMSEDNYSNSNTKSNRSFRSRILGRFNLKKHKRFKENSKEINSNQKTADLKIDDQDVSEIQIFKNLSEISVRFNCYIIKKILEIYDNFVHEDIPDSEDLTLSVTQYLNFLMFREDIDFNSKECQQHKIFEILNDLQENISKVKDNNRKVSSMEEKYDILHNKLETDDSLKQWSLLGEFMSYMQDNLTLYESNQKLKSELDNLHKRYNKKIEEEKLKAEEYEMQCSTLKNKQKEIKAKYKDENGKLKNVIEKLERRIEVDKNFIKQQHDEWEVERRQHLNDIDNLNKSFDQIKRSSSTKGVYSDESDYQPQLRKTQSFRKHSSIVSIRYKNSGTQTNNDSIIVLKNNITVKDLESVECFRYFIKNINKKEVVLKAIFNSLSDVFMMFSETVLDEELKNKIKEICDKETDIFKLPDNYWKDLLIDFQRIERKMTSFIDEGINIRKSYNALQEELEVQKSKDSIKIDKIKVLEDEIQNLVDYQNHFAEDYELLQSMLEEKQKEMDSMSETLIAKESMEQELKILQKKFMESQNVVNERDEDLYVLKEAKESLETDIENIRKEFDEERSTYKSMYKELEAEMTETQQINKNLTDKLEHLKIQLGDKDKLYMEKNNFANELERNLVEIKNINEEYKLNVEALKDDIKISELRLSEFNFQHTKDIEKLTKNLQESENINAELRNEILLLKGQLDSEQMDKCEERVSTIENLKSQLKIELDKNKKLELKLLESSNNFINLMKKIYELEAVTKLSVSDTRVLEKNLIPASPNCHLSDLLNESLNSVDTFAYDSAAVECSIGQNLERSENDVMENKRLNTVDLLNKNKNLLMSDSKVSNIADSVKILLNKIECAFQKWDLDSNDSENFSAKFQTFQNLVEDVCNKQFSILIEKITALQTQEQLNGELKEKTNFLMEELAESERKQNNLQNLLDKEMNRNMCYTEEIRELKSELDDTSASLRMELDREKSRLSQTTSQLKEEIQRYEKLEVSLSVTEERLKLVEESNVELIKKNRQLIDCHQNEMDNVNVEYADIFKRCNTYKLRFDSLQESLQHQNEECERTKSDLVETIKSNTDFRNKMNEFVKIYQDKRRKLEEENLELQQMLQISCRREISFIKENETMRMKLHSIKGQNKDLEKKVKELEIFIDSMQKNHEKDRQDWLNMLNGNAKSKGTDDGNILSQVNWLLRMLQLRMELLAIHYNSTDSEVNGCGSEGNKSKCEVVRSYRGHGGNELVMLLQSIKSMQSMISIYLRDQKLDLSISGGDKNVDFSSFCRPMPTGSSNSKEYSDSDTNSADNSIDNFNVDNKFLLQKSQMKEIKVRMNALEKQNRNLVYQKCFLQTQLPSDIRRNLLTRYLTEIQRFYSQTHYYLFKFKVLVRVVSVAIRLKRLTNVKFTTVMYERNKLACSRIPLPVFSTFDPVCKEKDSGLDLERNVNGIYSPFIPNPNSHENQLNLTDSYNISMGESRKLNRNNIFSNSFPLPTKMRNTNHITSQNKGRLSNMTVSNNNNSVKFSKTIMQIEDFGRRLDKYYEQLDG